MDTDPKQIAQMVKSGEYFEQSRAWYQTVYIGPISERSFFLLITGLGALLAILSIASLLAFLPVAESKGMLVANGRLEETVPQLIPMREKDAPLKASIQEFLIRLYVEKREGYRYYDYDKSMTYIKGQSDAPTFSDYVARYDRSNQQSPAAILGQTAERLVTIRSVSIKSGQEPQLATVAFTTEISGRGESSRSNWTATLQFYYSEPLFNFVDDPETGETLLKTQDPQFQVVSYVLSQTR